MKTARLLFWSVVAYAILLVLVRGALPSQSSPTLVLAGLPLIVIAVLIARDLARKATRPTSISTRSKTTIVRIDPVQFLRGQIQVAVDSSDSYFENVVRARLKELLISKVALESSMETETARQSLMHPKQGMKIMRNSELYTILYGPVPKSGTERLEMIAKAIDKIGEWKG